MNWFDVDKQGLGKLLERRGKAWALFELTANTLDTDAKSVQVNVTPIPNTAKVKVEVIDDDPNGFANLAHAYTLFAESVRKGDATKRGRFNLGEKITLALCETATIESTTGGVRFDAEGRHSIRTKLERGSRFTGIMKMTRAEYEEALQAFKTLIVPEGVHVSLNGESLPERKPVAVLEASLPSEIADEEGVLRRTVRKTEVRVYEPLPGETPSVYELGIPVVETGDKYHVNVSQKVPLTMERDNLPPAYLRDLRVLVLNATYTKLTKADANATWVRDAGSDKDADPEAMTKIADLRFGEKRVAYDPSDPEANNIAVSKGYTLVHGGMLNGQEWENIRKAQAILPAGQVTPSRPTESEPAVVVPEKDWTKAVHAVAGHARIIGKYLTGVTPRITIINNPRVGAVATYSTGSLTLNMGRLGKKWFEQVYESHEKLDDLLIHEFAHHFASNHLSEDYYDTLSRLGAKLVQLALSDPGMWRAL